MKALPILIEDSLLLETLTSDFPSHNETPSDNTKHRKGTKRRREEKKRLRRFNEIPGKDQG